MSLNTPTIPAPFQSYAHDGLLLSYGWRASGQSVGTSEPPPVTPSQAANWESELKQLYQAGEGLTATLAGLWLLWGDLDRSHEFSQSLNTPLGSLWHAVMHRLEGDHGNSLYWYSRAGEHVVFHELRNLDANYPQSLVEASADGQRPSWVAEMACHEWRQLFQLSTVELIHD